MDHLSNWQEHFRGTVRLFPINNFILFPDVSQKLIIFEPRYLELMENALKSDRLITMAIPLEKLDDDDPASPKIDPIVTIGGIRGEKQLKDGRWTLTLQGLSRARIKEEVLQDHLYRSADVELLEDLPFISKCQENHYREELGRAFSNHYGCESMTTIQVHQLLQTNEPLGTVCDKLCFALNFPMEFKRAMLSEQSCERRAQRFLEQLTPPNSIIPSGSPLFRLN